MADSFYSAVHDGVEFEFFDFPGSNLFNIRVESHDGANFERLYHEKHGVPIYGAAHLVEHLSFKSPLDYKTNEFVNAMQRIGRYNASTNFTMIDYLMETVASEWKTAIKMVCNSAFNDLSGVTQEEFETERGVVINEINRYAEDNSTMFMMGIRSAIIGSDPFDNILGDPAFTNVTLGLCQEIKTHFIASAPIRVVVTYDSNSGARPTAIVNEFFHNFERQTSDFRNDDFEELANPAWSKLVKEPKNVTVVNPAD